MPIDQAALSNFLSKLDPAVIQTFVHTVRKVLDAFRIEAAIVSQSATPSSPDYEHGGLSPAPPSGGWITNDELRARVQEFNEAMALEKWIDGFIAGIKVMMFIGGGAA